MSLYDKLGNSRLKEIITDIISASKDLEVDFFGVGALARNAWYVENNLPARGTKDVDFAIYIPSKGLYSKLKNRLINNYKYIASSTNAFCLISPSKIPVDLLPFGAIEDNRKVLIEGKGLITINLDGFKEVHLKGLKKINIDGDFINVCTIPSVVLLKLIAFDDRPDQRMKDPLDVSSIFKVYPNIESDFIWDEYSFLYEGGLSHESVSIKVIGFEVRKLILDNKALLDRVNRILDDAIAGNSKFAVYMISNSTVETIEMMVSNLVMLQSGINNER